MTVEKINREFEEYQQTLIKQSMKLKVFMEFETNEEIDDLIVWQ